MLPEWWAKGPCVRVPGVPPAGEGRQTETNEDGTGYFAFRPVEKPADAQEDDQ